MLSAQVSTFDELRPLRTSELNRLALQAGRNPHLRPAPASSADGGASAEILSSRHGGTGLEPAAVVVIGRRLDGSRSEPMTPFCERGSPPLPGQTTKAPCLQGTSSIDVIVSRLGVVSEGVARRRDASRVPRMCPECVRLFRAQATRNADFQAFF